MLLNDPQILPSGDTKNIYLFFLASGNTTACEKDRDCPKPTLCSLYISCNFGKRHKLFKTYTLMSFIGKHQKSFRRPEGQKNIKLQLIQVWNNVQQDNLS